MARPKKSNASQVDMLFKRFDLTKYQNCRNFDLFQWTYALMARHSLWEPIDPEIFGEEGGITHDVAAELLDDPLNFGQYPVGQPEQYDQAVESMSVWDAWQTAKIFSIVLPETSKQFDRIELESTQDRISSINMPPPENSHRSFDEEVLMTNSSQASLFEMGTAYVTINLNATDKELLASFRKWLESKRESERDIGLPAPKAKEFSEKNCSEWVGNMVLPYLDLKLIAKAYELDIPNFRIGSILFDEQVDIDVAEKVRKVVKPCADRLMNGRELMALYLSAVQALRE